MASLDYSGHCAEILAQTSLARTHFDGADLTAPVPSCPGWNLGQLARHLGAAHRWAASVVESRVAQPFPDDCVDSGFAAGGNAAADEWLADGAARLVAALGSISPDARVWTETPDGTPRFWARRMTHETVVHRFDAAATIGTDFDLAPLTAADGLEEWLDFSCLPVVFTLKPQFRELFGPGRGLAFHATDALPGTTADWFVDLGGDAPVWRRGRATAAVTVRGPVRGLLLGFYGRRPEPASAAQVSGDASLLRSWLDCSGFWLQE